VNKDENSIRNKKSEEDRQHLQNHVEKKQTLLSSARRSKMNKGNAEVEKKMGEDKGDNSSNTIQYI